MKQRSKDSRYNVAASKIRAQFVRSLQSIHGKPVKLANTRDTTTPPLSFNFVDDYLYREGVAKPDPAMAVGCGLVPRKQTCRPNMGGDCGCEYTRFCECLEYSLINRKQLNEEERAMWEGREQELMDEDSMGLPKRFPYSKDTGLLISTYLEQRWPIYECNDKCQCGPKCKSRLVQRGRTVGLEVFRTKHRGWGE
jgi:histone-lysine N-methyltransferase SUV39H